MPLGDNDVNKTLTTLKIPPEPRSDASKQTQWDELRAVFPIYLALAKQLEIQIPFAQDKRNLPENAPPALVTQVQTWLDSLDQRVQVHQLRHLLQMTTLNASESGLRALILRHLRKPSKTTTDRDKVDFLLVQYFALCAPAKGALSAKAPANTPNNSGLNSQLLATFDCEYIVEVYQRVLCFLC